MRPGLWSLWSSRMAAGSLSIPVALFLNHPICCLTLSAVIKSRVRLLGFIREIDFCCLVSVSKACEGNLRKSSYLGGLAIWSTWARSPWRVSNADWIPRELWWQNRSLLGFEFSACSIFARRTMKGNVSRLEELQGWGFCCLLCWTRPLLSLDLRLLRSSKLWVTRWNLLGFW